MNILDVQYDHSKFSNSSSLTIGADFVLSKFSWALSWSALAVAGTVMVLRRPSLPFCTSGSCVSTILPASSPSAPSSLSPRPQVQHT